MNFFKKLFGLDSDQWSPNHHSPNNHYDNHDARDSNRTPLHGNEEGSFPDFPRGGFDIFTNPLEMHRYFEQHMDEMLKTFGFSSDGMPSFDRFFSQHGIPALEDGHKNPFFGHQQQDENQIGSIRDHFLKRGYEHPESRPVDKDVDKEFNTNDLGSILGHQDSQMQAPVRPQIRSSIFGQSVSIKTIRNPDGSLETHKTVKNSDGTEETQITRRLGEKEYTIIKKRDRNGQEEVIENLLNMEENEKHNFLAPKQNLPYLEDDLTRSSLWDKFFK